MPNRPSTGPPRPKAPCLDLDALSLEEVGVDHFTEQRQLGRNVPVPGPPALGVLVALLEGGHGHARVEVGLQHLTEQAPARGARDRQGASLPGVGEDPYGVAEGVQPLGVGEAPHGQADVLGQRHGPVGVGHLLDHHAELGQLGDQVLNQLRGVGQLLEGIYVLEGEVVERPLHLANVSGLQLLRADEVAHLGGV